MARIPRKTFRRKAAEPISYKLSNEVRLVAEYLVGLYHVTFGHLRNFKLAYVLIGNKKAPSDRRVDALVRAFKSTPLWRELSGYHGGVAVNEAVWQPLDARQRNALVYHALAHLGMSDKGDIRVERHEVEAFLGEARYFGDANNEIVRLAEQLDLFERSADMPAEAPANVGKIVSIRKPDKPSTQPPASA